MADEVINREKILPAAKKFAVLIIAELRFEFKEICLCAAFQGEWLGRVSGFEIAENRKFLLELSVFSYSELTYPSKINFFSNNPVIY